MRVFFVQMDTEQMDTEQMDTERSRSAHLDKLDVPSTSSMCARRS